jgi:hypothetical protein
MITLINKFCRERELKQQLINFVYHLNPKYSKKFLNSKNHPCIMLSLPKHLKKTIEILHYAYAPFSMTMRTHTFYALNDKRGIAHHKTKSYLYNNQTQNQKNQINLISKETK